MDWPLAIDSNMIYRKEDEKDGIGRAVAIIDAFIPINLIGKRFLDFGADKGFLVREAKKQGAKVSVGYDITPSEDVTDNWDQVIENGPYDVVMLYDVLDHTEKPPADIMNMISQVTTNVTSIFVTVHPWISRHGGHSHYKSNKAFSHLFSGDETVYCRKNISDFGTYKTIFEENGFIIQNCGTRTDPVDDFFFQRPTLNKIVELANKFECSLQQLVWKMRNSFYDFVLKKGIAPKNTPYPLATCHHTVGKSLHFYHTLYSNGTILPPFPQMHIAKKPFPTWNTTANTLTFFWPHNSAPGGTWIDICNMTNFQVYNGHNQDRVKIRGKLI